MAISNVFQGQSEQDLELQVRLVII